MHFRFTDYSSKMESLLTQHAKVDHFYQILTLSCSSNQPDVVHVHYQIVSSRLKLIRLVWIDCFGRSKPVYTIWNQQAVFSSRNRSSSLFQQEISWTAQHWVLVHAAGLVMWHGRWRKHINAAAVKNVRIKHGFSGMVFNGKALHLF